MLLRAPDGLLKGQHVKTIIEFIVTLLARFVKQQPRPASPPAVPPAPSKPVAVPADSEPPWLAHSAKELGVKETPGPQSTRRVVVYRKIAGCELKGDDGDVPWCRIYVCAMLALAGIPYRKDWMARAVERDVNFVKLDGPALGAICSFWRGSRGGGLGHTGFYRGETGSKVLVEGGNESDAVRRAFYPKQSRSVGLAGYYWPKGLPRPKVAAVLVSDNGQRVASAR
jgi:uncharacterized protein (TIGR02594 family)